MRSSCSSPGQPSLWGANMPPATQEAPRHVGAVHAHGPAVERRATGHRQTDDAAADDGQGAPGLMGTQSLSFLRRHDPDQV